MERRDKETPYVVSGRDEINFYELE